MDDPRLKMSADREAYIKRLEDKIARRDREIDRLVAEKTRYRERAEQMNNIALNWSEEAMRLRRAAAECDCCGLRPVSAPHWYENAHK